MHSLIEPFRNPKALAGRALIAALLALMPAVAAASTNVFWIAHTWQSDEGLPDNTITGVAQTSDGYVWVSTTAGFVKFDGVQFQEYQPTRLSNVVNRVVRIMKVDRANRHWLVMDRGSVVCLEPSAARVYANLPDNPLSIVEDREGSIWISYAQGDLTRIKNGEVTSVGGAAGFPDGAECWLTTDNEGQLWFARGRTLGMFRDERFQTVVTLPEPVSQIYGAPPPAGGIWVACGARILKYTDGRSASDRGQLPAGAIVTAMHENQAGTLWIGTTAHGLFRSERSTYAKVRTSNRAITTLVEDREGNLWVGTKGGGLNRIRPRATELLNAESGAPFDSARSVCQDAASDFWVVTWDGGLFQGSGTTWENVTTRRNWPGGVPVCVTSDKWGAVWIGTRTGLLRYYNHRYTVWKKEDGLASETIRSLLATSRGDVWIGADNPPTLQRLRDDQWLTLSTPEEGQALRAMAEDANGDVWIGTSKGHVLRVTGEKLINETERVQGWTNSIRALHISADGALWIGYAVRGLGRWKDGKYTQYSPEDGLPDHTISQLMSDQRGRLWLASNRGIFRLYLKHLDDFAKGEITRLNPVSYGRDEGLRSLQASFDSTPGTWRSKDGRIWMSASSGLTAIYTENVQDNTTRPQILLERVSVDGKPVAIYQNKFPLLDTNLLNLQNLGGAEDTLHVQPGHRKIQFDFTAFSFSAPERVRFRYQLEGFDNEWVEAGSQRSATYTRLEAGDYRFRVMACNETGLWNEAGTFVNVVVLPFFWQTWWFQTLVVLGFVGASFAVTRRISVKRMKRELEELEHETALENSRIAGMAEVATSVLHNVGNVVNSVNVSNSVIRDKIRASKISFLAKIAAMLEEHEKDLPDFIANDPKGKQLPKYLSDLARHLAAEQQEILQELSALGSNIEHIKGIVTRQQAFAKFAGGTEMVNVAELVEDAIQISAASVTRDHINIVREFSPVPGVTTDKHQVLQILVNLLSNAKHALRSAETADKRLTIRVEPSGAERVRIAVVDNGIGISRENMNRLFQHGFTTKKEGHGFGLHSCNIAARELGGSLKAHSDGLGKGAAFTLELPTSGKNSPKNGSTPAPAGKAEANGSSK